MLTPVITHRNAVTVLMACEAKAQETGMCSSWHQMRDRSLSRLSSCAHALNLSTHLAVANRAGVRSHRLWPHHEQAIPENEPAASSCMQHLTACMSMKTVCTNELHKHSNNG